MPLLTADPVTVLPEQREDSGTESSFCAGSMLMDPDVPCVDENIFEIGIIR